MLEDKSSFRKYQIKNSIKDEKLLTLELFLFINRENVCKKQWLLLLFFLKTQFIKCTIKGERERGVLDYLSSINF